MDTAPMSQTLTQANVSWVKGRLRNYVGITTGGPQIADELLQRPSRQSRPSRPGEFHPEPLTGRVEDWRAGLGRSLYSLFLALSFASVTLSRPCHVSSPRHVERSVRISRTALSCLLHLKGYGTYRAGATFGISQRTL
jgi:hypothetical protein